VGRGPIHGLKLGHKILTPRNLAFEIRSVCPHDAASGLPSGKRQHTPLTITTESDGSPSLLSGLPRNQAFAKIVLYFWNTNARGKPETVVHTVELTNAQIASYKRQPAITAIRKICLQAVTGWRNSNSRSDAFR